MIRVAFVLNDIGDRWLGGVNYYRNLFSALELIENRKIAPVVFLGAQASDSFARNFKSAEIVRSTILDRKTPGWIVRKVASRFMPERRDPLLYALLRQYKIDVVSHYHYGSVWWGKKIKMIGWIPDFQHLYYPNFFLPSESSTRDVQYERVCRLCDRVILSSNAVRDDLKVFAPGALPKSRVLRFVPDVSFASPIVSLEDLKRKYGFKAPFFFLPNQFHIHKNHRVVVEALAELKKKGAAATVVATGNTADYRRPDYFPALLDQVTSLDVKNFFKIIGMVPYEDLVSLMCHSIAVINPSLFEGWSTTVEEAKALNKVTLLSDIAVHREQNPNGSFFFNPNDCSDLAEKMFAVLNSSTDLTSAYAVPDEGYQARRANFACEYQKVVIETVAQENP